MFYIIGLGLGDEKDITLRGLQVIRDPNPLGSVLLNVTHYNRP
jgi:diphthamide biosynthesis methyltransferase